MVIFEDGTLTAARLREPLVIGVEKDGWLEMVAGKAYLKSEEDSRIRATQTGAFRSRYEALSVGRGGDKCEL